ncbi:unnamed protein product [Calicophoron daubneyi]|uniref:Translation machinery-associated protein 16 n=1 Tax=Calicophoron daubneyi TaxID=300641 RepID=A0AAV2TUT7_CALDB
MKMKNLHPKSRKAGQIRKQMHHDLRVAKKNKEKQLKNRLLETKLRWFRDNFPSGRSCVTHAELTCLVEQYLHRARTPSCPLESESVTSEMSQAFIDQENNEYHSCGIKVPDLTTKINVENIFKWNDDPKLIPTIVMKTIKKR